MHIARLALLIPLAACASEELDETTVEELTQVGIVTTRGISASVNNLADWNRNTMIDPTIVDNGTLRVRVCIEHFPIGSQARTNLVAALTAYNTVPGVAIDITDIAGAAGTGTHPNLATFALPTDAIYVDYDDTLASNVFASMATIPASCDASSPQQCTQARIYVNPDKVPAGEAPSVGVFMHELGHVFGMQHINEDDDSLVLNNPTTMSLDRTIVHGNKLQSDDFRSTVIHGATLAFLQSYYPEANDPDLATNEIVVHRNTSVSDGVTHIEFNPSKSYQDYGSGLALIADLNETKLRWNVTAGVFEPCTLPGTTPRWFARMSDTSTNAVNTQFQARFQVSSLPTGGTWTTLVDRMFDSHNAAQTDYRQIDWDRELAITATALNVAGGAGIAAMTQRRLRFEADSTGVLAERNESNNSWWVNLCLYPASDTTCEQTSVVCAQP
jgi:hypothetical protein